MPRARNLKPGFFKDAKVVSCSFESRLLFQGMWCLADYMGRLKYVPIEIKMEIFPADQIDIEKSATELESAGLISRYRDHSGMTLVQIEGFTKHQNPHINERQDSKGQPAPHLPGPDDIDQGGGGDKTPLEQRVREATRAILEYYQSDPADSLNLIPDSLKFKGQTPKAPDRFADFWSVYPKRVKKAEAKKKWKAKRLDDKADEIIADVEKRKRSDGRWLDGFVPDPTTYINGERWDDEIEPRKGADGKREPNPPSRRVLN